eukprot:CAMPEP_0184319060 /NCGR_PEP_ID=MMETSP1049-20130417/106306_1 /TAXON_ID=77928 /ORGANISM="Proteomonas sulcata, Strain CCMP704" /LENGTH=144 /DNA_ID=CAMNT_0026639061 /DNA_START=272 /DNA_END=706 /DNA_ORIENTATION=+
MAEAIARKWFAEKHGVKESELKAATGWDIRSAALTDDYEKPGSPASANGVTAMQRFGCDLRNHRSQLITRGAIESAEKIFCVSNRHRHWILEMVPSSANKTFTLGQDIPDPWHQEQAVYDACAKTMMACVPAVLAKHFGNDAAS